MKATLIQLGSERCFSHTLCMWMSNCKCSPSLPLFSPKKKGDLENRAQLREPANILIFNTTRSDTAEYRCEVAAIDDQRDFDEILISLAVRGTVCRTPPRTGERVGQNLYSLASGKSENDPLQKPKNWRLRARLRVEDCTTEGWNRLSQRLMINTAYFPT